LSGDKKKKFCTPEDFMILFKEILETHSGLEFLKDTPDFQDWYSLCVMHRMFYMANRKGDYKLTFREFKKSKILRALFDIENEPDINRNPDFFSYEDFYVIYRTFWKLDLDHDFFL
jgi:serine/threonine-protein phosphatase 2A regulatory subunit B''